MRILVLVLIPIAYMHVINLTILYEKTGLQEVKEMYYYVVEKLLEKFNEHLQRRGIRIGLMNFLAYDDYLVRPEYLEVAIRGGEENLDARIEALKDIPTNVILVASASPEEERERYVFNSPCMSRFVSNMVTREIVDDELLTKIIYAVFDWMGNLFKTTVPNPIKERSPEVFDKFAKEASTPEFIESLKKCSRDTKEKFESFTRKIGWNGKESGQRDSFSGLNPEGGGGVEISSPLKWVLSKQGGDGGGQDSTIHEGKAAKPRKRRRHAELSSSEECSEENESQSTEKSEPRRKIEGRSRVKSSSPRKLKKMKPLKEGNDMVQKEIRAEEVGGRKNMWEDDADEMDQLDRGRTNEEYRKNNFRAQPTSNSQIAIGEKIREELQKIFAQEPRDRRQGGDLSMQFSSSISPTIERRTGSEKGIAQTPYSPAFSSQVAVPSKHALKIVEGLSYGRIPYKRNQPR